MTPEDTKGLLLYLTGMFPNFTVDENRIEVWTSELADFPKEACRAAVQRLLKPGPQFAPNVAQIKAAVSTEDSEALAHESWASVDEFIRRVDAKQRPSTQQWAAVFPEAARVIEDMGGLEAAYHAKHQSHERYSIMRAQFLRAFAVAERSKEARATAQDAGLLEGADPIKRLGGGPDGE